METLKVKKGPIILPLLLLAASLAVYTFFHFQTVSAADCLTLGQRHLNDLNYEAAIAEFTNAIELDPNSVDARLGLAQAYAGNENYELSKQILEPMVYGEQPEEQTAALMVELLEKTNQNAEAVNVVWKLIETTDEEAYYQLLIELLGKLQSGPRSYAVGTDQALRIRNGQVRSQGSNLLGQLGAPGDSTELWRDARFSGAAEKVACVGRTSFVIDQEGALWAAGENRWGQWGEGYAITAPENGWSRLNCPGKVVDVAGTTGRLLVLLEDGTLWTAGAESGQNFTRLSRFPLVTGIASNQWQVAVRTAGGQLYVSETRSPSRWELAGREVCDFTLSDNSLCWVDRLGNGYVNGSQISFPEELRKEGGLPVSLAQAGSLTLCRTQDGALWQITGNDSGSQIHDGSRGLANLYPQGGALILEYENGDVRRWDDSMAAARPLT